MNFNAHKSNEYEGKDLKVGMTTSEDTAEFTKESLNLMFNTSGTGYKT